MEKEKKIKNEEDKKEPENYMTMGMSLGMCFGMAIGSSIKKDEKNNK